MKGRGESKVEETFGDLGVGSVWDDGGFLLEKQE